MFRFKRSILPIIATTLVLSACGGSGDNKDSSAERDNARTAIAAAGVAGVVCDADADGDVDRLDIGLISEARNTPAVQPDDPRDADGDGNINILDARACTLQCSEPRCAVVDPVLQSVCDENDGCFPNGLAAGDVDQTSVVLWTRASFIGEGTVTFEYGTDPDWIQPAIKAVPRTVRKSDITTKIEVTGLEDGKQYYYRVCRDSCPADVALGTEVRGRFHTLHAAGKHGLRFGVSSCFEEKLRPFVSINNVPGTSNRSDLDFFVALGDTTYADNQGAKGAQNLGQFRNAHKKVYSKKSIPEDNMFALARGSTAFFATIDDHEVVNNFSGGMLAKDQLNTPECNKVILGDGGLGKCFCDDDLDDDDILDVNDNFIDADKDGMPDDFDNDGIPDGPDPNCNRLVNDTEKFEDALQAFHEFNPIRKEKYGDTKDDRTKNEIKLYRYRTFGKDAAMFMLDTRSFRDANALIPFQQVGTLPVEAYLPGRTMLGKKQLNDLLDDLRSADKAGITWKFIMVPEPIQNIPIVGVADRFEGFAHERAIILDMIDTECIDNVVFISGDIHGTLVNNLTYKKTFADIQRFSTAWDISTGAVAYEKPLGVQVTPGGPGEPRKPRDLALKILLDGLLTARRRPWTGLGPETFTGIPLQQQNRFIPARLSPGFGAVSYVSGHSFGWSEFEIDKSSQELTVTTWGTPWYNVAGTLDIDQEPEEINKFVVTPSSPAKNGESCLFDKNCNSCRCAILSSGGLLQCTSKLPNDSFCAINSQCQSDRCRTLICQAKEANGNRCLTNNDCASGRCRTLKCQAKEPSGNICLTNNDCRSGKCRQSGLLRRCN